MASANRRPSYEEDSSDSDRDHSNQENRRKRAILKRPQGRYSTLHYVLVLIAVLITGVVLSGEHNSCI